MSEFQRGGIISGKSIDAIFADRGCDYIIPAKYAERMKFWQGLLDKINEGGVHSSEVLDEVADSEEGV